MRVWWVGGQAAGPAIESQTPRGKQRGRRSNYIVLKFFWIIWLANTQIFFSGSLPYPTHPKWGGEKSKCVCMYQNKTWIMIDEKGHERIFLHVIIPEKQKKCPFTPPTPNSPRWEGKFCVLSLFRLKQNKMKFYRLSARPAQPRGRRWEKEKKYDTCSGTVYSIFWAFLTYWLHPGSEKYAATPSFGSRGVKPFESPQPPLKEIWDNVICVQLLFCKIICCVWTTYS